MARSGARLRSRPVRFGGLVRRGPARPALRGEALGRGQSVGLFGGSFDPVHDGHVHVAETAMQSAQLDRIWWLVSPQNPLKTRDADQYERRIDAVLKRVRQKRHCVSDVENRLACSHTAGLLTALKKRFPGNHFIWIMGADNLASIHRWWRWTDIFRTVPVVVLSRPQDPVKARLAPAARRFARARLREGAAHRLAVKTAPAWTYLVKRLNSHSSTALRARQ